MNPMNRTQVERFRTEDVPEPPGRTVCRLCVVKCDHHSCVNDRGEKPKTKKKNYPRIMFKRKIGRKKRNSGLADRIRPNSGSDEEGFSKEIKPKQNTIYQSLLQLSTENNFVM